MDQIILLCYQFELEPNAANSLLSGVSGFERHNSSTAENNRPNARISSTHVILGSKSNRNRNL